MSTCRMQNAKRTVEMLKITLITPQHVTTAFFFFGCKLANQQTWQTGSKTTGKPGKSAKPGKEEESAQKSEESRCV